MTGSQVNQLEGQSQDWTEIRSRWKQRYQGPEWISEPERNSRSFTWVKRSLPGSQRSTPTPARRRSGLPRKGGRDPEYGPRPPQLPAFRFQPTTLRTRVLRPPPLHVRAGGGPRARLAPPPPAQTKEPHRAAGQGSDSALQKGEQRARAQPGSARAQLGAPLVRPCYLGLVEFQ